MSVKAFLDTNLFVYLYSDLDISKKEKVIQTINPYERFVSTQVLNEFCNVCTRKLNLQIKPVHDIITQIVSICNLIVVDDATVISALNLHEKYQYSYYDSLILASALESDCKLLLSEDMQDGQIINDQLMIRNIFKL